MAAVQLWRYIPGNTLLFLINAVSATALVFEGKISAVLITYESIQADILVLQDTTKVYWALSVKRPGL